MSLTASIGYSVDYSRVWVQRYSSMKLCFSLHGTQLFFLSLSLFLSLSIFFFFFFWGGGRGHDYTSCLSCRFACVLLTMNSLCWIVRLLILITFELFCQKVKEISSVTIVIAGSCNSGISERT